MTSLTRLVAAALAAAVLLPAAAQASTSMESGIADDAALLNEPSDARAAAAVSAWAALGIDDVRIFVQWQAIAPGLVIFALVLGRVQGMEPKFGVIIHGRDCRTTRVHFKRGLVRATRTLEELARLGGSGTPPPLVLNDHCQVCEFRQGCLERAEAQDDISLIRGLGERAVQKLKKKGITTVTQLSHTFRPRKE